MRYVLIAAALFAAGMARAGDFDTGQIPKPVILTPSGPADATVILFSSETGWSDGDAATARRLQAAGAAVVGIDLPGYLAALDAEGKDCVYLVSDFERLSHAIERSTGASTFHAPLIAGSGEGGRSPWIFSPRPPPTRSAGRSWSILPRCSSSARRSARPRPASSRRTARPTTCPRASRPRP